MINTRSTYYQEIDFVNPSTSVTCESYTLSLYIWSGIVSSVPSTATYELTRKNYESSTGSELVEIGRLIKSYLEINITDVSTGSDYYNESGNVWVKTTLTYDDDSVEQDSTIDIALYGYGYGNEGMNYQVPSNGILITNRIFKVSRNSLFTIPVYCDSSKAVSITTLGGTYSNSYTLPLTSDSSEIIKLITIDTSTISDFENRVTVSINGIDIILILDNDERYNNTDLMFINKYGGQQTVSMRKERKEGISVRRKSYERSFNQPSDGYHQIVDYLTNGKEIVKLSSGYVPESDNATFKELLLSDRVWMKYEGETIPVNVKSSGIDYKTRAVDKLINYEIEVGNAYNEINII